MNRPEVITVVAALACLILGGCVSQQDHAPTTTTTTSRPPPAASTALPAGVSVEARGGRPIGVAQVNGNPWYALAGKGSVAHPGGETSVGRIPLRLAPGPDGVWVSVFGDGAVTMLGFDGTIIKSVDLGATAEPEGLAVDGDVLWVVDQSLGAVQALETTTGEILTTVAVGKGPRLVTVGPNDVWVSTYGTGEITAIDRKSKTQRVSRLDVCSGAQGIAEAAGTLWVACTSDDTVIALNNQDLSELTRIDLEGADAITTDGNHLIAVGQVGPTVLQIDPATKHEQRRTVLSDANAVSDGNIDAAIVNDTVVITHPDTNRVYRLQLS